VGLDASPLFFVRNYDDTLIYSSTGAESASGNYYEFYTLPSSLGMYSYHWHYTINANTFHDAGLFEIVKTAAIATSGYYCSAMDVINAYEPLRESDWRYHEVDQEIADVQAIVNNMLGTRYSVPFETGANSLPGIVPVLTKHITLANLLEQTAGGVPEWVNNRRDRAMDLLKSMAVGSESLVLPDGTVMTPTMPAALGQVDHNLSSYEQTFNFLSWSQMRIDPDRIQDEEDALD
jgi:phage gp36-like protein